MAHIFITILKINIAGEKLSRQTTVIISQLRVQNFRCILDESLPCEKLIALVGPNGSGKSSFLRALEMFYTISTKYTEHGFYNENISKDIIITVEFTQLTEDEKELFQKYVEGENLKILQ